MFSVHINVLAAALPIVQHMMVVMTTAGVLSSVVMTPAGVLSSAWFQLEPLAARRSSCPTK